MVDPRSALRSVPAAVEVPGGLRFRTVHGYRRAYRIAGGRRSAAGSALHREYREASERNAT